MEKHESGKKVQAKIYLDDRQEKKATRTISGISFGVPDEKVYEIVKDIFSLQKYEVDSYLMVESYDIYG